MSTYTPIASITLASNAASVTFSGIPQTYTDLVLVVETLMSGSQANTLMRVGNGSLDTGSNYSGTHLSGNGSSASSSRDTSQTRFFFTTSSYPQTNTRHISTHHFLNYSNTTTNKTVLIRSSNAAIGTDAFVGLWRSTSAINTVSVFPANNDFASGSTFNLYGIANASLDNVAKATGGDSVYTDGTYWYHIFRSSGTFTPTQALTADYLVVAGGGAGGNNGNYGGGGGAGGLRCTVGATGGGGALESALSLTAQAYTVTVGAGGTAGTEPGGSGSNSVFATITSTGGGGGGSGSANGATGGSGGGAGYHNQSRTGGAGTANQGYAGGNNWFSGAPFPSGGGGGAGAAGANATATVNGNGGNGVTTSISGTSTTYAGGGGGGSPSTATAGTGGTGGGGNGAINTVGTAGTANTGGGGGNNVAGGSGIVVIRYSAA